jgi:hypothetical protein
MSTQSSAKSRAKSRAKSPGKKNRKRSRIRTVMFQRDKWSKRSARTWLYENGFRNIPAAETTKNYYRYFLARNVSRVPDRDKLFYTIYLSREKGVLALIEREK